MSKTAWAALFTLWLSCILIPLAILFESHDSVAVKSFLFSVTSGLMLFLAGMELLRNRLFPEAWFMIPGTAAILLGVLHLYPGSGMGSLRTIQLLSAAALFTSLGVFRFETARVLLPVALGALGALGFSLLFPGSGTRLSGTFGNPNLAGAFAAAVLPAGAVFMAGGKKLGAAAAGIFAVLCIAVVIRSGTRSALLAIPLGTGAVFLARRRRKILFPLVVLAVTGYILVFFQILPLPRLGGTMGTRQSVWEGTAEMAMERPVAGWGTGAFQPLFPLFRSPDFALRGLPSNTVHAHSEPGELLAENGFIGLFLWTLFWWLYFLKTLKGKIPGLTYAALAGIAITLADGAVSVALRWTSQVFILTVLAGAAANWKRSRVNRFTAIPLAAGGLLLIILGGGGSLERTRASVFLFRALEAQSGGKSTSTVETFCRRSIGLWGREPAGWFILGNQYGLEAESAENPFEKAQLIQLQLAAYDSLEARCPDYAWAVQNRASALLATGRWDPALDRIMYVLRTRHHLKAWAVENGVLTAPLASDQKALEFAGHLYSMMLSSSLNDADLSRRLLCALGTVYAAASVRAPEVLPVLDSICVEAFSGMDSGIAFGITFRLGLEARYAPEDNEALENYLRGIPTPWPQFDDDLYSPYRVALACRMAADSERTDLLETALFHSSLFGEDCYFLTGRFPGGEESLMTACLLAEGESDSLQLQIMDTCLRNLLEMNAFIDRVEARKLQAIHGYGDPALHRMSPQWMARLSAADDPGFLISLNFTWAACESARPGSRREEITRELLSFAWMLEERYGAEAVRPLLTTVTAAETEYLENGPFRPLVYSRALELREALLDLQASEGGP